MKSTARRYTFEEKRDALEEVKEVGPAEASRRLDIPAGTLHSWSFQARQAEKRGDTWPVIPKSRNDNGGDDTSAELVSSASEDDQDPAPRRIARTYTPSQRAEALELASKIGVTAASSKRGISRYSIYDWRRKVKRAAAGLGPSPTSGPDPADVEATRDAEIVDMWKKHPGLGPSQIKNQLRKKNIKVSTNTARRVMEDAGYRPPKVRRQEHTKSFEAVRPNHMWHLDFVHRYIGRASTFILILIDDCSRFVVGHGVDDAERADMVITTFEDAVTVKQRGGAIE